MSPVKMTGLIFYFSIFFFVFIEMVFDFEDREAVDGEPEEEDKSAVTGSGVRNSAVVGNREADRVVEREFDLGCEKLAI